MKIVLSRRSALQWTFAIGCSLGLAASGMKPAAADALENITKAGVIKIGLFEDFPPFASLGSEMKIEGYDIDMAENLAAAAGTMLSSPGAMQLRTLQTIDGLGPSASNTVILAVPIEILELARSMSEATHSNGRMGVLTGH